LSSERPNRQFSSLTYLSCPFTTPFLSVPHINKAFYNSTSIFNLLELITTPALLDFPRFITRFFSLSATLLPLLSTSIDSITPTAIYHAARRFPLGKIRKRDRKHSFIPHSFPPLFLSAKQPRKTRSPEEVKTSEELDFHWTAGPS